MLMTDGFPELFNRKKEMLDYSRIKEKFARIAAGSSQQIINTLVEMGDDWRKGEPQADDFTFVVVKVKNT